MLREKKNWVLEFNPKDKNWIREKMEKWWESGYSAYVHDNLKDRLVKIEENSNFFVVFSRETENWQIKTREGYYLFCFHRVESLYRHLRKEEKKRLLIQIF